MKLKDIKVGGIYKPVSGHCGTFEIMKGVYIKIISIEDNDWLCYDILDKNIKKINSCGYCFRAENLEFISNRSEIGKKAYKTFLKNGGKRDSQGRFSKPTRIIIKGGHFKTGTDAWTLTIKPEKLQVDWERIGKDIKLVYISYPEESDDPRMVKRFANIFKKHGLLKEGVKI